MFIKIKKTGLLIFMIMPLISFGQNKPVPPCATNDIHEERMRTDSNYRKEIELVEKQIQAKLAKDDSVKNSTLRTLNQRKKNRKSRIVK